MGLLLTCAAAMGCERRVDPEASVREAFVRERAFAEDAGAAWTLTSNADLVFDDGWSPMEWARPAGVRGEVWRWMGRTAVIRLRRHDTSKRITINGWVPLDLIGTPPTMTVRFDGVPIDTFIPPPGRFDRSFVVPATSGPGRFGDLELQTTSYGSEGEGKRDLGYALVRITITEAASP